MQDLGWVDVGQEDLHRDKLADEAVPHHHKSRVDDWSWLDDIAAEMGPYDAGRPGSVGANPEFGASETPLHEEALQSVKKLSPEVQKQAHLVVRQNRTLNVLHEELVLLRRQANYELETARNLRQFADEARTLFIKKLEDTHSDLPSAAEYDDFRQSHQNTVRSHIALSDQELVVSNSQNDLTVMEHHLMGREKSFAASAKKLSSLLVRSGLSGEAHEQEGPGSADDLDQLDPLFASEPKVHPLLAAYFDTTGDLQVMQERLDNVVADHHEERAIRNFREEQGHSLSTTETEFEARYARDYSAAGRALSEAVVAAARAKNACLDHAIDLTPYEPMSAEVAADEPNSHMDMETPHAEGSPSSLVPDLPVVTPASLPLLALDDRNASSTVLNTLTGHLTGRLRNTHIKKPPKTDRRDRVAAWVDQVEGSAVGESQRQESASHQFADPTRPRPLSTRSLPLITIDETDLDNEHALPRAYSHQIGSPGGPTAGNNHDILATRRPRVHARRPSDSQISPASSRHDSFVEAIQELKANPP